MQLTRAISSYECGHQGAANALMKILAILNSKKTALVDIWLNEKFHNSLELRTTLADDMASNLDWLDASTVTRVYLNIINI